MTNEFDEIINFVTLEQTIKLVNFAEKLGSKKIAVLFTKQDSKNKEWFLELSKNSNIKLVTGLIVKTQKEAQKFHQQYDFLLGKADRGLIEAKNVKYITNAENIDKKDKTHYRLSGLNQVTAKILANKKKTYLFNLNLLLNSENKELILGRMMQNKMLFKKYKVNYSIVSFAVDKLDLRVKKERDLFLTSF